MARVLLVALLVTSIAISLGCGGGTTTPTSPQNPPPNPDFIFNVNPLTVNLVAGTSTQFQVKTTPLNNFNGTVSVSAGSLPAGITVSPALPQNVGTTGLTLSVTAASNATNGILTIPLTASSGALQHSANLGINLGDRANISLSVPIAPSQIAEGGSRDVDMNIYADSGIVDFTVQLNVSTPTGITASIMPNSVVNPGTHVSITLTASVSAPVGSSTVVIKGTRSVDGVSVQTSFPIYIGPQVGAIPGNRTNWVRIGSNPSAAYYDAPRNHVLVSVPAMNRVDVIDPGTGNRLSSISTSVGGNEPNGLQLISSSNLTSTLDGNSLLVLGAGHVSTVDLASGQLVATRPLPGAVPIGWTTLEPIFPTFAVAASGGHMILGSWGSFNFYNWDGVSSFASLHALTDIYSFDRNWNGTKVLVASGGGPGECQLLNVASDNIEVDRTYPDAVIMTVRGNPKRDEWAMANSNGIDFLDGNLNLIARVPAAFLGSITYWGMTYSADGKYLYFVYSPGGLPFLITVDATSHTVVRIAPATGTDIAYFRREPPEWIMQPFAADNTGLVFGLGEKGLVIDDSTYNIDPTQATYAGHAIIATPDSAPLNSQTPVQITTQSYQIQPDVWFGGQRALNQSMNGAGQVSATAPPGQSVGPVNIKLFPPDGYTHVMPQAFSYGTTVTYVRNSICPASGGCSTDIFGFGLFGSSSAGTTVTIGGNPAQVKSIHYLNGDRPYPYPLQYVTVAVPAGTVGRADVNVHSPSGQATLPGAILYASSVHSYPSTQTYNSLLYDRQRSVVYASTNSNVARYSVSSGSFLTPITPPSVGGQSQFEGMALTPDSSRLLITNKLDGSVAVIDPDNLSNAHAITVPAIGANAGGPVFVSATSTGKAIISIGGFTTPWTGPMYELDLNTSQFQIFTIPDVVTGDGPILSSTADGKTTLLRGYGSFAHLWNAETGQFTRVADGFAGSGLGSASGDGNIFAVGLGLIAPDGTSTVGFSIPDEIGGFQSISPNNGALNDSGSLEFVAVDNTLLILDTHHGEVLRHYTLPNRMNVWMTTILSDPEGEHVFFSDSQGLTVLSFASAPLAIGSISPQVVFATSPGTVTVRGSGFQPTTAVTIGGKTAIISFVDSSTLNVTVPSNPVGASPITIRNADGETYRLDAGITYR